VSFIRFFGIVSISMCLHAQNAPFPGHAPADPYSGTLFTASGDAPLVGDFPSMQPEPRPIAGVVSLRELEHPIPAKALRAAYQAQQLAKANQIPKAIAKFEKALYIYPRYRDARVDLGVQYARVGRLADARAQFEKALEIGPPAPAIYFDLALASLNARQYDDAAKWARKALESDPQRAEAESILNSALSH
jgi:tetratricopeptide (TPR) repeat protein